MAAIFDFKKTIVMIGPSSEKVTEGIKRNGFDFSATTDIYNQRGTDTLGNPFFEVNADKTGTLSLTYEAGSYGDKQLRSIFDTVRSGAVDAVFLPLFVSDTKTHFFGGKCLPNNYTYNTTESNFTFILMDARSTEVGAALAAYKEALQAATS
tara:strand:- start:546 stop:1001 length:456 start_codon:yes stop_codon:yes gene_type:complete